MVDKRCFVQFSHPGSEHRPDRSGKIGWNKNRHKRKFMQLCGKWIERDGRKRSGDLWTWGEWEPESDCARKFDTRDGHHPRYLWCPYYSPKNSYHLLLNTDPFIFGKHFLYSNCLQLHHCGLKHLEQGSVIAFGSGKKVGSERKWMLDTVLVIGDSILYDPLDPHAALKDWVPDAFLHVTGGPLTYDPKMKKLTAKDPEKRKLRLYRGATPDDPICGMFSFFPAKPASSKSGFPRPFVDLQHKCFNSRNWQAPKGHQCDLSPAELRCLWNLLVAQVRDAGLVLGTRAKVPPRRNP